MRMNIRNHSTIVALAFLCLAFVSASQALDENPPANAEELVARHLDSIATSAIRAGFKTRVATGPVHFTILVGGAGTLDGKSFLVSSGDKLQFMLKLPNNDYHGEQFIFDGQKDSVAYSRVQQTRSAFGNFVFVQDAVIREGLLGGVLTTAWPLLNLNERSPKLSFDGLKKIDGQELYQLRYRPHKSSDLEINLYFDPQTYRHLETTYNYSVTEGLTRGGETATAGLLPNRYRLTEKFSDFKTVDGVTLPTHDDIQFSQEIQNGHTTLWQWDVKDLAVSNNVGLDAKNFEVK